MPLPELQLILPNPMSVARDAAKGVRARARDQSRTLANALHQLAIILSYILAPLFKPLLDRIQISPPENVKPYLESAQYEIHEGVALLKDALASRGWWYPIRGIFYITAHPHFYEAIRREIIVSTALSTLLFVYMIFTVYVPQTEWLSRWTGPFGSLLALPLVLSETYVLVNAVMHLSFIDIALDNLFDATLLEQGQSVLVSRGRAIRPHKGNPDIQEIGSRTTPPRMRLAPSAIMGSILLLPLTIIPLWGLIFYCIYNGWQSGPSYHSRYFELRRMVAHETDAFAARRQAEYTAFGAIDIALGFVPVFGCLAVYSSTVGAALWAADIERNTKNPHLDGRAFPDPVVRVVFAPESRSGAWM